MKILIIGGTRFMGPMVVRRLINLGHSVTVFHRGKTTPELPTEVKEIVGDRNELGKFRDEFTRIRPDIILDMILLTEAQARELVKVTAGIAERLVIASSCDVYRNYGALWGSESGFTPHERLTEDSPLRKNLRPYRKEVSDKDHILYNYDKIPAEQEVIANLNLRATILRLPMVYGPGDYQHRFYGYIRRMTDGRPFIMIEEGQAEWRVTRGYGENCADAICLGITAKNAAGKIYNVGEPQALTEKEWILKIAEIAGWRGEIICLPKSKLPVHLNRDLNWQFHLDIDTSKIREDLGYKERIGRADALKFTIEWERNNPPKSEFDASEYAAEDEALKNLTHS